MTIKRLDHVSVVVDDLAAAIAFFTALGMTLEDEMPVEGPWVDRVNGLESVQVDIVMMRTPDGHGRLELTKFRNPKLVEIEPAIAPPNALGLRSVMFTVESVDDTVARLRANGICPLLWRYYDNNEPKSSSFFIRTCLHACAAARQLSCARGKVHKSWRGFLAPHRRHTTRRTARSTAGAGL